LNFYVSFAYVTKHVSNVKDFVFTPSLHCHSWRFSPEVLVLARHPKDGGPVVAITGGDSYLGGQA